MILCKTIYADIYIKYMNHCPLDTTIQTNYSFTEYHHPQHDAIIIGNWIYIFKLASGEG